MATRKTRAAKKVESVGPGGCGCLCKSCDDQRHCHRPEKGCRANEPVPRKRKTTKPAKPVMSKSERKRRDHQQEHKGCDYSRYAGTVDEATGAYRQFDRLAKLLGEVQAGIEAFWMISKNHGLLGAPGDGSASICQEHAAKVHEDVNHLTDLLSPEAKMLLPILFMIAGGNATVEREGAPEGETIH